MKIFIYLILIILGEIGVNSAQNNDKKKNFNKKCNQCRVKGRDTFSPVCGRLNDVEETFRCRIVFECFAKCRKVEYSEFLYDGECQQTPQQCKEECYHNTPLRAPPACEGNSSGFNLTTYLYEALLDCYINCPDNNLNKLHRGPCIADRRNPTYTAYRVLAPYDVCFNKTTPGCQLRQLKALEDYSSFPMPRPIPSY